ncbi:hypothetical protein B4U80_01900 [Leptotrombidium deliense]|uniref:SCP domain-containing protein n=1 Tax=Leptotrombidium deliense TaxID=299467 RepID=A0A443SPC5_9ACAR|nr:hypothetical protein B4U80_01900 [Leptotrombidium deliense]
MNTLVSLTILLVFATIAIAKDDAWFQDCLSSHNKFREGEQKPALKEGQQLMEHAQKRVKQLVESCKFDHNGNSGSGFGENLYAGSGSLGATCSRAVTNWYNEKQYYDKANPGFSMKTGHYTQVVWKSTTELGCAKGTYPITKNCRMGGWTVVVCSYNPPGNYVGKYEQNV